MTTTNLKSGLFLIAALRQLILAAQAIHCPQMFNTTIFELSILSPLPLYLVSLAITDAIRQKYKPDIGKKVTRRFAFISLSLAGLYAIYPVYILVHQLYHPASPLAFTLYLSAGETLFGCHLRTIFKSMFHRQTKK